MRPHVLTQRFPDVERNLLLFRLNDTSVDVDNMPLISMNKSFSLQYFFHYKEFNKIGAFIVKEI